MVATVNALGWQADAPLRDAVVMCVFGLSALPFGREAVRAVGSARGILSPAPPRHAELPLELWLIGVKVRAKTAEPALPDCQGSDPA